MTFGGPEPEANWPRAGGRSALAGLACRIAAVAFGLAGRFILDNAGNPCFLGGRPLFGFPASLSLDCGDPGIFLRLQSRTLGRLETVAFRAPFLAG